MKMVEASDLAMKKKRLFNNQDSLFKYNGYSLLYELFGWISFSFNRVLISESNMSYFLIIGSDL